MTTAATKAARWRLPRRLLDHKRLVVHGEPEIMLSADAMHASGFLTLEAKGRPPAGLQALYRATITRS